MFDKYESIRMNNMLFMEQIGLVFIYTLFVSIRLTCLEDQLIFLPLGLKNV